MALEHLDDEDLRGEVVTEEEEFDGEEYFLSDNTQDLSEWRKSGQPDFLSYRQERPHTVKDLNQTVTYNDWYLHRTLDGEWNGAGTLFIDKNNGRPFEDFLTIIYGHHMRDGSMFGSLVKYRDEEYYRKHKELKLYTPERKYDLEVIGVCTIPASSEMYKYDLDDEEEKAEYIGWIEQATETVCDERADVNDRIVMLSTCTYEFSDARLTVFCKIVNT